MDIEKTIEKKQEINILKISNTVLDIGLRAILPDFLEEDIIDIKNSFIEEGFVEGLQTIIDKLEDLGKSITGIFTGDFETVEQVKRLIQNDGILDGVSDLIDKITKKLLDNGKINKNIYNLIKSGKKEILNILKSELKNSYQEDTYSLEKLNEYCQEWKENYKKEDYEGMKKSLNKIKQRLEKSAIVEKIINEARTIEKIENYIEKKGSIDKLTKQEKELLEKIN
ncbi:MAG: hypothetical protein J6K42_08495 [Clostridia bacterium]|nr:hypothetical protein [Clostridia bacterium]MBP3503484.1 hypothetical protein [Clostridia bacterium]